MHGPMLPLLLLLPSLLCSLLGACGFLLEKHRLTLLMDGHTWSRMLRQSQLYLRFLLIHWVSLQRARWSGLKARAYSSVVLNA